MSVAPNERSDQTESPEDAVRARYSAAARAREAALCCPNDYDPRYLEVIPREVLERDYGCGDPSRYIELGDTVLDLGSGGGKICFIAAQIVGANGRVIGVDMNEDMLTLARGAAPKVAEHLGYDNVAFRQGRIQDLTLDLQTLDHWLGDHPARDLDSLAALQSKCEELRRTSPLVRDQSVDIVVSNCVLNLVREEDKSQLIREIFRVLKVGGRIAISDIVSDEATPQHLRADPEFWSGCISGAFEEQRLLRELEEAGFHGIALDKWEQEPFAVVEGIEFRSVTVTARKGKQGRCYEANQAVIYRGPWKRVEDDDGHVLVRGERAAVCAKTFGILTSAPYEGQVIPVEPHVPIPEAERKTFDCRRGSRRDPRETKGHGYRESREPATVAEERCC